ncbi:zinc finger BED domain-containing protein 5-like [Phlebotomus papatasi]|uniref:zinc finger BED domain-containing protein 5-like n=1 Tax=Phlebotomus papatasi TaxID=29031 RepID=UPI0024839E7C|nr:zinc finger BED domain-containing protein 5-like [Phlebotomus papatasi]XP_055709506.1 zinc finger BED domain-containing protein 5-like [Phlebotomus papatasi]
MEKNFYCKPLNDNFSQCTLCGAVIHTVQRNRYAQHWARCPKAGKDPALPESVLKPDKLSHFDSNASSVDKSLNSVTRKRKSYSPKKHDYMSSKEVSKVLALELARNKKPYADAAIYKNIFATLFEKMGKSESAKLLKEIPCSSTTIMRHTCKLADDVRESLKQNLNMCDTVSICLDETTDITDESQMLIFVRGVYPNGDTFEEMLQLKNLKSRTTGAEVYQVVMATLEEFDLIDKLFSITTDGARSLCGHLTGLYGLMSNVMPGIRHYHCLIHQVALSAKFLSNLPAPKQAIRIINGLRGGHNSLTHRRLKRYLEENKAPKKDLLLHTEVRWLSLGKALRRLFDLRKEIGSFAQKKDVKICEELKRIIKDHEFWKQIAFFTDITGRLNDLNLSLQVYFYFLHLLDISGRLCMEK